VTESEMESATKGKSTEARVERWIDSVGTVTLPLLAGFSITSVVASGAVTPCRRADQAALRAFSLISRLTQRDAETVGWTF
jgi:hypothetical protein